MSLFSRFSARHGRPRWTSFTGRKRPQQGPFFSARRSQSTSTSEVPQYKAKKDSLISPTMILIGLMPVFTFALGTWQVQRLKWKINLIDELEEKLEREPMTMPRQINLAAIPDFAYRKVLMKGTWDHAHSILLGPRVHDGTQGYHLVVPLIRSDGSTVLVDRGFISKEFAENGNWTREPGEAQVLGMLKTGQVRNRFTPDNHPEKGEWFWADVNAMAEYAGGETAGVQPVYVEEIFSGHAGEASSRVSHGVAVGRTPTVDVRNSHASYVFTWYSLSAFTTFMFVRLLLKQRRAHAKMPR